MKIEVVRTPEALMILVNYDGNHWAGFSVKYNEQFQTHGTLPIGNHKLIFSVRKAHMDRNHRVTATLFDDNGMVVSGICEELKP